MSQSSQSSRSSARINGKKRFQITGFSTPEKERLSALIKRLGGEYLEDRAFKTQATHVVCEIPNRSEKFLGACATGTWLVKSSFLDACDKANGWVDEDDHEWTDKDIRGQVKHPFLYRAPRKWRKYVRKTERLAFESWRVILIIDDANMKLVFRRLLEAGGALAVIARLPPKVDRSVTHIFVKTSLSYEYLKPWKEQGVPCLAPDYIGDFLVEDTLPALCSRDIFLKVQQNQNQQLQQQQKRTTQQTTLQLPRQQQQKRSSPRLATKLETAANDAKVNKLKVDCSAVDKSVILDDSSLSSSTFATPIKSSPSMNSLKNLVIKIERFDSPRSDSGSSTRGSNPNSPQKSNKIAKAKTDKENKIPNGSTKRSNSAVPRRVVKAARIGSPQSGSNSDSGSEKKKDSNNNSELTGLRRSNRVKRVDYQKLHCGQITPTDEEKKKNFVLSRDNTEEDKNNSTTEAETSILTLYGASPATSMKRKISRDDNPKPLKKMRRYEDGLHTIDQFCFQQSHSRPSSPSLPMSVNIEAMVNTYYEESFYVRALEEFERYVTSQSYPTPELLWKVMAVLFTSTNKPLSNAVFRSLRRLLVIHPPNSQALNYFYMKSMQFANSSWEFLTAVIDSCKGETTELEGLALQDQIYNNKLLLEFLAQAFSISMAYCENSEEKITPVIASVLWTSTDIGDLNYRVRHLVSLVMDATDCTKSCSKFRHLLYSLLNSAFRALQYCCKEKHLNGGKSHLFISELARKLLPHITNPTNGFQAMQNAFASLRDTLLGVGVCASILDTLDNIVFVDTFNDISLGKILGHYLFSIPRGAGRSQNAPTPSKKEIVAPLSKAIMANVNKRNLKGETKLHRACMKGDATMVRQLLNVSGINVNIQDFAGWTALHEACNNGNVECVQLLLDYKPPKTLESYFSQKAKLLLGVDLYLCDPEGTTPLHDAVINHRVEIAKLLVKKGGRKVIEKANVYGQTPVDLAATDEMMDSLIPHDEDDISMNSSQIDCSQLSTQSEDLNEMYTQTDSFNCTSVSECRRFLLLFECLLHSFIHVKNLGPDAKDIDEIDQNYLRRMPRYVRKLKRHIERIVVEEGKDLLDFSAFNRRTTNIISFSSEELLDTRSIHIYNIVY